MQLGDQRSSRRSFVRSLAAVVAVAVVGVGASWVWWLTNPGALRPVAIGVELTVAPGVQAAASNVATNLERPIEIVSVRPAAPPPEGASLTLIACRWIEGREVGSTRAWDIDERCAETRPVEGLVLAPLGPLRTEPDGTVLIGREWDIVAVVDLGDQLAYATDGFVVEYRDGWRRGSQLSGYRMQVQRSGGESGDHSPALG